MKKKSKYEICHTRKVAPGHCVETLDECQNDKENAHNTQK